MEPTVGIAEAMVATAAALAPARVASADIDTCMMSTSASSEKINGEFIRASSSEKQHQKLSLRGSAGAWTTCTSRASLGEGKLLIEGCTAHRRHGLALLLGIGEEGDYGRAARVPLSS